MHGGAQLGWVGAGIARSARVDIASSDETDAVFL
jgi:hypothetical protein